MLVNKIEKPHQPFTIEKKFLLDKECNVLSKMFNLAKKSKGITFSGEKSARKSNIFWLKYDQDNVDWLFKKCNMLVEKHNSQCWRFDLTGFDHFQCTEYNDNLSHYSWHTDETFEYSSLNKFGVRKLSVSILLNDCFIGGEFEIDNIARDKNTVVNLSKGDAILFPSIIPHKVNPVTSGCRKSLVFWVNGPMWR